jgi:hypothetical protein
MGDPMQLHLQQQGHGGGCFPHLSQG